MRIVELGEYSMVIMRDSEDPPTAILGDIYRDASDHEKEILVDRGDQLTFSYIVASDYIYGAGRLVLFFKDTIPSRFKIHDKVYIVTSYKIA